MVHIAETIMPIKLLLPLETSGLEASLQGSKSCAVEWNVRVEIRPMV